jgi:hypothetical protein
MKGSLQLSSSRNVWQGNAAWAGGAVHADCTSRLDGTNVDMIGNKAERRGG